MLITEVKRKREVQSNRRAPYNPTVQRQPRLITFCHESFKMDVFFFYACFTLFGNTNYTVLFYFVLKLKCKNGYMHMYNRLTLL